MSNVFIGTSGYYYKDWENQFYPPEVDKKEFLVYYSRFFDTVEVNSTYYSFPNPYFFLNMSKKVPKGFTFSLKAHASMTHSRDASEGDYKKYFEAVSVLKEKEMLGAILFQFPYSFRPSAQTLDYLKHVRDALPDLDIAIEFRNSMWVNEKTMEIMKQLEYIFCNVDEPRIKGLMPETDIITARAQSYIRFHGRNSSNWYQHKNPYERYDYEYDQDELNPWAEKIKKMSCKVEKTLIYFNNHYKAQAVRSARLLQKLLSDESSQ
jgi:uncharacterized protein YecE (DUF72 family)